LFLILIQSVKKKSLFYSLFSYFSFPLPFSLFNSDNFKKQSKSFLKGLFRFDFQLYALEKKLKTQKSFLITFFILTFEEELLTQTILKRRRQLPAFAPDATQISIWSILRKAIGKDLSKISLPVILNEPLSILQVYAYYCFYFINKLFNNISRDYAKK
jgi:hypothetical protein